MNFGIVGEGLATAALKIETSTCSLSLRNTLGADTPAFFIVSCCLFISLRLSQQWFNGVCIPSLWKCFAIFFMCRIFLNVLFYCISVPSDSISLSHQWFNATLCLVFENVLPYWMIFYVFMHHHDIIRMYGISQTYFMASSKLFQSFITLSSHCEFDGILTCELDNCLICAISWHLNLTQSSRRGWQGMGY